MATDLRIVSLVPSHTETLFDLGVGNRVVGRTRFCIKPEGPVDAIPHVGGTKDASLERIVALRPSLVVADKDENPKALVDALTAAGIEVLWSDIATIADAAEWVERLANRCGVADAGKSWGRRIRMAGVPARPVPVFCPIWHGPWMTFDGTAYPDAVLRAAGFRNVFAQHDGPRYFEVTAQQVAASSARWALLPTEPFPFHKQVERLDLSPLGRVGEAGRHVVIDGEALTWFGTRTAVGIAELAKVRARLS